MYHTIFVFPLLLAPAASLEIVCGNNHNCLFERGTTDMKCWGLNGGEQLGYGDANNRGGNEQEMGSNLPFLNLGSNFVVEAMSLGRWHSCAMSDDRAMKCFGSNANSQLGFDGETTTGDALPFLEFGADFNLSTIATGQYHTCTLSTDAALKCFGRNNHGQCGAGTATTPISGPPSQINATDLGTNFTLIDVQTFYDHVCVLSQQQTVKCFGYNNLGELGYGDTVNRGETPESTGDGLPIVDLGSDFIVAAIATGGYHSCALSTTKKVKCWGCVQTTFNYGQCGTPHSMQTGDNLPVLDFGADFVPMQLALGGDHTCVLSENATLICFGRNECGQLGIGNTTDVHTPITLTGIDLGSNFVPRQVAAGWFHTCAVSTGDDIKCWGDNQYGQLGLGHSNNMGDGPNEMGDNLPFVDVGSLTASPSTSVTTTADPTTIAPTTPAPTTPEPVVTTAVPTRQPSEPTAPLSTTVPTTAELTTSNPSTGAPIHAAIPTTSPTTEPIFADPTTFEPTPQSPTTSNSTILYRYNYTVTINTHDLNSTQILIAIAAVNLSSTPLTWTVLSSRDGEDGLASVELLVVIATHEPQDYDVIKVTLKEAMVEEYGDDIEVDIAVGDAVPEPVEVEPWWAWLLPVAYCIASVCFCFAVAGIIKCILAKRRPVANDDQADAAAAQLEMIERPGRALPVNIQNEDEEKNHDIQQPGAGEPDLASEHSASHRDEGLRASIVAQTAMGNMAADEFEVVDDRQTKTGYSANYVRADPMPVGMQEDECEVHEDNDAPSVIDVNATNGRTRDE